MRQRCWRRCLGRYLDGHLGARQYTEGVRTSVAEHYAHDKTDRCCCATSGNRNKSTDGFDVSKPQRVAAAVSFCSWNLTCNYKQIPGKASKAEAQAPSFLRIGYAKPLEWFCGQGLRFLSSSNLPTFQYLSKLISSSFD
jgi:hypothetical protein